MPPLLQIYFSFVTKETSSRPFSHENKAYPIHAFNSKSYIIYLDDLLNIDIEYFEHMVYTIYLKKLQLNKSNTSDTTAPFLDFKLSISNGIILLNFMIKRDNFGFEWRCSSCYNL